MTQKTDNETTLAEILAYEEKVWGALVAGDPEADGALLSKDFLGVYTSGFSDRAAHMAEVEDGPSMAEYRLSEARLMDLGEGQVLLAYRADFRKPQSPDWDAMYISSIWKITPSGWINIFSQDTPAT
ncbi:nuclear transport factor 2 family protein [Shimia thalassica]|uniref:nuclear transport factor 2 family protein n=1 Tax=Shimia thalassica TaxID=1715693 RepID=UPI000C071AF8|nr:nuclear transport factor 2 family protein [Shimia thalassica]MDO6483131.1 nuclear transport factor 2 family protein [Shimia thalassica]PHO02726.1 DUF4440 domain-containing protein [Rhodobacteraceae bacterium 4F10]